LVHRSLTACGLRAYRHTPARSRAHPSQTTYRLRGSQAIFRLLLRTPLQHPGLSWTDQRAYSPVLSLWCSLFAEYIAFFLRRQQKFSPPPQSQTCRRRNSRKSGWFSRL